MPVIMLALVSSSPSIAKPKDEEERPARVHPRPPGPNHGPRKIPTQSAKCAGIDKNNRPQFLTLESRWMPNGDLIGRTVLFVLEDSTGFLKAGSWLENAKVRGNDRKHGIWYDWNGLFVKFVGDRKARIEIRDHEDDTATVTYVTAPGYLSDEEPRGRLSLVGRCRLFVKNEPRSYENRPRIVLPD